MNETETPVECPVCHELVHWLPDLNRTVAHVGYHGPDAVTDCAGSWARVTRPVTEDMKDTADA